MAMPNLKLTDHGRGGKPNFDVKNLAPNEAEIFIYDDIGPDWAGMIGAQTVARALKDLPETVSTIYVRVNSPGGSVWEASAIYNQLTRHDARVVVDIDGIAASAATFIAMAGDEIRMSESALLMIHNPWTIAIGTADDLLETAEWMEKTTANLVSVYAKRTGKDEKDIEQWMDDETWFTAAEANDAGFVDTVTEAKSIAASVDLSRFRNPPEQLRAMTNRAKQPDINTGDSTMDIKDVVSKWKADNAEAYNAIREEAATEAREAAKADLDNKVNEAKTASFDEGTANERERVLALAKTFNDRPDFLVNQIEAGHDVAKAKSEAYDTLKAEQADKAKNHKPEGDAGRDPLNMAGDKGGDDPVEQERLAARKFAEQQNKRK